MVSVEQLDRGANRLDPLPTAQDVTGLVRAPGHRSSASASTATSVSLAGRGVPPQQVVVVRTDLTGPIMVPYIVIIDLGKRDGEQPRDQEDDSQQPQDRKLRRPSQDHAWTSLVKTAHGKRELHYYGISRNQDQANEPSPAGERTDDGRLSEGPVGTGGSRSNPVTLASRQEPCSSPISTAR